MIQIILKQYSILFLVILPWNATRLFDLENCHFYLKWWIIQRVGTPSDNTGLIFIHHFIGWL